MRFPDSLSIARAKQVHITLPEILKQIYFDLVSKGVQTGYSASYSWLADQFGHLGLGFISSAGSGLIIAVILCLGHWGPLSQLVDAAPAFVLIGLFAAKEWNDYLDARNDAAEAGAFPFRKIDVIRDAATAVFYFTFGVAFERALAAHAKFGWLFWSLAISAGIAIGGFWLPRKMCFQRATLPAIFRLANFRNPSLQGSSDIALIERFVRLEGDKWHLLVVGPVSSGKTTLGCAIGTEASFRLAPARYFTLTGFGAAFQSNGNLGSTERNRFWSWQESKIIILDDISLDLLSGINPGTKLSERRMVWLLANPNDKDAWEQRLTEVFDSKPAIITLTAPAARVEKSAKVLANGFG
jgi:hypothetical protein